MAQRIGILVIALALLATLVVAGAAIIRGHPSPAANGSGSSPTDTTSPSPTPTPAASSETYFVYQDSNKQFSISRPQDWTTRALSSPDPNIALIVGPNGGFPVDDFVAITFHQLPFPLSNSDVLAFKDAIIQEIGSNVTILEQTPSPVINGHAGYFISYTAPATNPNTFHQAYYLIDGDRFVTILLQTEPVNDTVAVGVLTPVFQQMAQSFKSYHVTPTPTSTATTPTSTQSTAPTPTPSPSHS